jgi:hypothetical protein
MKKLDKKNIEDLFALTPMQDVTGSEDLAPGKSMLLGAVKTIPHEYENIFCRSIDVVFSHQNGHDKAQLLDQLYQELTQRCSDQIVAYRGSRRWTQTMEPLKPASLKLEEKNEKQEPITILRPLF